ncbi:hypothetical protein C491_14742 [Natronococcus amylolyticus DSM 10524]|uniref:Uncharacterized protein n=1 Tax=Natronococcus amylolyticus DSM 10524 TaxID=1227497 RepID=L9X362_9EURY|nr:hypothetical protein C491_14742 [Natronococcus amylolyticus DSM 10524]
MGASVLICYWMIEMNYRKLLICSRILEVLELNGLHRISDAKLYRVALSGRNYFRQSPLDSAKF